MSSALLEVEDLRVHFGPCERPVRAVDGVSLSVAADSVVGLVGESGAGKSVVARTVIGLTAATDATVTGRVLYAGRDLLSLPARELRRLRGPEIAIAFQDPLASLHPLRRVGVQVVEAVRAHRSVSRAGARRRAAELLEMVGLADPERVARSHPHELAGGARQRVALAIALAHEPRLLIADEPTTALDVTVQAQILALLGRLRRELGMALLLITHDLGVVAETAGEVAVMYAGKVVERGPAAEVFARPGHPYTWGLLRSVPRLDSEPHARLAAIPGRPPSPAAPPTGCRFHPRCAHVRDAHRRVDPPLEAVAGEPGHLVACLLSPSERARLRGEGDP